MQLYTAKILILKPKLKNTLMLIENMQKDSIEIKMGRLVNVLRVALVTVKVVVVDGVKDIININHI